MTNDIVKQTNEILENTRNILIHASSEANYRRENVGKVVILTYNELQQLIDQMKAMKQIIISNLNTKFEKWPVLNQFSSEQLAEHLVELISPGSKNYDLAFNSDSLYGYWEAPDGERFKYYNKDKALEYTINWLNSDNKESSVEESPKENIEDNVLDTLKILSERLNDLYAERLNDLHNRRYSRRSYPS